MKTALGKGLGALIPESDNLAKVLEIELGRIVTDRQQPRKNFNESALKDLAASIKEKGVIQPVIVAREPNGSFKIIAGERRFRASKMAGLKKIPAIVRDTKGEDALEIALIENIQREDLNPVETAKAFQRLMDEFGLTQEKLALRVGKERATVANYLRLLALPPEVLKLLDNGALSMGHARAILAVDGERGQIAAAKEIISKGLSVREAEKLAKKAPAEAQEKQVPKIDPNEAALQEKLIKGLGTKVKLKHKGKDGGTITIEYYSLEELDRLLDIML